MLMFRVLVSIQNRRSTRKRELIHVPGCGINGALYFVKMDADGGLAKYSTNKAGAPYGTGYCDAQCPRDLKFIAGKVSKQHLSF
jgi:cellulose 1,4-beta-cellobiosidase